MNDYIALEYMMHEPDPSLDGENTMILGVQHMENMNGHGIISTHLIHDQSLNMARLYAALLPGIVAMFPSEHPNPSTIPIIPPYAVLKLSHEFPPSSTSANTQIIVTLSAEQMTTDCNYDSNPSIIIGLIMTLYGFIEACKTVIMPYHDQLNPSLIPIVDSIFKE